MIDGYFEEFKKLGYTDNEAKEFAEAIEYPSIINPEIDMIESVKSLIDRFNSIPCTSFLITEDELREYQKSGMLKVE